ncbi:hypothetical protein IAG25_31245 [Caballeronia sp. EK]|uniref:YCF48-related protein n=1 Tax=Caballeronia sp. EK TaxID=2767469 RepID=UPI0016558E64|nr:YCF48-related protein [Caballeronia sp. EK]MBC8641298.1 hypothetical protein [Caballeronia sp. EK]
MGLADQGIPEFVLHTLHPQLNAIAVTRGGRIISVGSEGSIVSSDDDGRHWKKEHHSAKWDFQSMASSRDGRILWLAATSEDPNKGEVIYSQDEGITWKVFPHKLNFMPFAIATTSDGSEVWVAGSDGNVWHSSIAEMPFDVVINAGRGETFWVLRFLEASRTLIAAGRNGLIAIKREGGSGFERRSCGYSATFSAFATDADSGQIWLGGTAGLLCRSEDQGKTWLPAFAFNGKFQQDIEALAFLPPTERLFIAGSAIEMQDTHTGQWLTLDQRSIKADLRALTIDSTGRLWASGNNGAVYRGGRDGENLTLLTEPADVSGLRGLAASKDGKHIFAVGPDGYIRTSLNAGEHWDYFKAPNVFFFGVATDSRGSVAYAVGSGGAVYRWALGTTTWQRDSPPDSSEAIHAVWMSGSGDVVVLANTNGIFFRRAAGEVGWRTVGTSKNSRRITRIASNDDDSMLAAVGDWETVMTSTDGGRSWQQPTRTITDEGPDSFTKAVAVTGERIWVNAAAGLLAYSDNRGATWREIVVPGSTAIVDLIWAKPFLWIVKENGVSYTVDNGKTFSIQSPDPAVGTYIRGSAAQGFGKLWLATYEGEVVTGAPDGAIFPVIRSISAHRVLQTSANEITVQLSDGKACAGANAMQFGTSMRALGGRVELSVQSKATTVDSKTVKLTFDLPPDTPKDGLSLIISTACTSNFNYKYQFDGFSQIRWYDRIPGGLRTVYAVILSVILPALSFALYLLHPLSVLTLQQAIATIRLPFPFDVPFVLFEKYLLLKYLCERPRVLDAWMVSVWSNFSARWQALTFIRLNTTYTPLQIVSKDENGSESDPFEPSPNTLRQMFLRKGPISIQIVGIGGIGKTTLAAAVARWLTDSSFLGHRCMVVPFDTHFSDVSSAFSEAMSGLLGSDAPSPALLSSLLRNRRIVPIFDRFSEQDDVTREAGRRAFRATSALDLCLFTTRTKIETDAHVIEIWPQPIRSATRLTNFVERELIRADRRGVFERLSMRAWLVTELSSRLEKEVGLSITPLLAAMFVEIFVRTTYEPSVSDLKLPDTAIETFLQYFYSTVQSGEKGSPPYDTVIAIGEQLAVLSLANGFSPKPFPYDRAVQAVVEGGSALDSVFLNHIIMSGILVSERKLGSTFLAFTIDTLAQVLAAHHAVRSGDGSDEWWQNYRARYDDGSEAALDFLRIASMVRDAWKGANAGGQPT